MRRYVIHLFLALKNTYVFLITPINSLYSALTEERVLYISFFFFKVLDCFRWNKILTRNTKTYTLKIVILFCLLSNLLG